MHILKTDSSVTPNAKVLSGDMYFYGLKADKDWIGGGSNAGDYAKNNFKAEYAKDYYCTKVSSIHGYDLGQEGTVAWTGFMAGPSNLKGSKVSIAKGETLPANDMSLGLTNTYQGDDIEGRKITVTNNTSNTHGGGIGCNGALLIGNLDSAEQYAPVPLEFDKKLVTSENEPVSMSGLNFEFALYATEADAESGNNFLYKSTNDAKGKVRFEIDPQQYLEGKKDGDKDSFDLYLKEVPGADEEIVYDSSIYKVSFSYTVDKETVCIVANSVYLTSYKAVDLKSSINRLPDGETVTSITNVKNIEGAWTLSAKKFYYGSAEQPTFDFALEEINAPESFDNVDLVGLSRKDGLCLSAQNGDFDGIEAPVAFPEVTFWESGDHWYRISEANGADPTVYVAKVEVRGDGADGKPSTSLVAQVTELYYADSMDATTLKRLEADADGNLPAIEFHNNDESGAYALSGYAVNALSGAPLTQKCLVDPKIIKELEGRTITPGEFSFQLIEVADYAGTTGEVISETTNDADGMVDFDAAANKADPGWEPSCLLFTQPGTYKYRVIEDPKQLADPSVDYSTQVITFTVTVELNPDTGVLAATDMYYGYLNEAGENVRYKEQYTNWEEKEKDPTWVPSINDYADYDPTWHPTMTNRAKPQDLVVKKSSALTGEALEGAIYALYLVNHGGEADLRLANGTSDADGLIYFEDVSLKVGNLYYFMEEAAPAGHTVSKFRSKYFYLVPDANAGNGYAMRYTDNKFVMEEASDELVSAHELDESYGGNEADPLPTTEPAVGKDGALLYAYEADGGVQDEATYVEFNKLDTRTHEWVEGAQLSIVEKETGRVVNAWTSGKAPEVLQKALNVDVVYVLREDEAPEGYERAADVEFRIDSYGAVEILSGTENGNAELAGSTITLYDTRLPIEETVTETRETTREVPRDRTLNLAKTGDALPLLAMGLLALGALVALVLAARRTRKGKHSSR